ncbi:MAG: hypothetical protein ANABAC_1000 [Anaerolineae bacterium]|jgi:uncharacterized protein (DUF58 family)|nr:MAG: hypothetical protein ANABAC_1000 [Anaerolineae bacterium]
MNTPQKIVVGLFLICLLGGLISGATFYYRLAYLWGAVWIFAWLYSLFALRGLRLSRVARFHRAQVGQIFEERIEVTNHSRVTKLWLAIHDESALPEAQGSRVISYLKPKETRSYFVRTRLVKRGFYSLGPTRIVAGDPFGLFMVDKVFPAKEHLLVYPMTMEIKDFPNPAGWISGGEAMRRKTHQITPNAAGVREYMSGDPLNRIHWLSTARRGRLMVKEFELDPLSEVWIFLDADKNFQYGKVDYQYDFQPRELWRPVVKLPLPGATFEYQIVIAASLARHFLRKGRAVGLAAKGRNFHVSVAERGFRQLGKLLEMFAILEPEGDLPLPVLVESQGRLLPRGSTTILISSAYELNLSRAASFLSAIGHRPIAIWVDPTTFEAGLDEEKRLKIIASLSSQGIPHVVVRRGDDLVQTLSGSFYLPGLELR